MVQFLIVIIYLAFISLGLPDALLGASWPTMHLELGVPVSYAGAVSLITAAGTVLSSLQSDRLTRWLGAGKVTAISVAVSALALFGFSISKSYWMLCLWAIPYGLGAGSVDACLNNYVALHYPSRHMSWLHCMWGIGASTGPYVLAAALAAGLNWNGGYRIISFLQAGLTAVLFLSLPLWKKNQGSVTETNGKARPLTVRRILKITGAKEVLAAFFCYCALETTTSLWASSYLVMYRGLDVDTAAGYASLYFLGITLGRFLCGFLTYKINDTNMIRLGQGIVAVGVITMLLPLGSWGSMAALALIGLGCAPVYPSIIHSTPEHFGEENSQAIIGVQMAFAYVGICVMPPLFGVIANHITVALLPVYLAGILGMMIFMCEQLNRKTGRQRP